MVISLTRVLQFQTYTLPLQSFFHKKINGHDLIILLNFNIVSCYEVAYNVP